jgi:FMN phosphatase YigB (HAD superfamily)
MGKRKRGEMMNALYPTPRQWTILKLALLKLRALGLLTNEDHEAIRDLLRQIASREESEADNE